MKILIIASGNHQQVAPFVAEQAAALRDTGNEVQIMPIVGRGIIGYLRNYSKLREYILVYKPNIVHAHYGFCGLLATLQRRVPVVVTYHGSDINSRQARPFSQLAMRLAAHNIFVSEALRRQGGRVAQEATVLPCGVNPDNFPATPRAEARQRMGLRPDGRYVLFAGAFDNPVKDSPLARAACALLPGTVLLELKGYSRTEVALLMSAADALLMTSRSEGSPQVVKEAMATGLPVVSVDVGDVADTAGRASLTRIVSDRSPEALAAALRPLLDCPRRSDGRAALLAAGLDNPSVARRLMDIYTSLDCRQ